MKHEEIKELLELYTLGSLDSIDSKQVEAHLLECLDCRQEVAVWREMMAELGFAAEPASPRAELRSQLLTAIQSEAQILPFRRPAHPPDVSRHILPPARAESQWLRWWALVASIGFISFAAGSLMLWQQLGGQQSQVRESQQQLAQVQRELLQEREKAAWLASPQAVNARLLGTKESPAAQAKLSYDPQTGRTVLIVYNLPPPPPGKAYQLWFIADGVPVSGGVFKIDQRGKAEMEGQVPNPGRSASLFAVTLEPEQGVPSPTGEKYLLSTAL
ncbi:MAG: anti-sigma factor [Acidobacteria bacterium]|nr:anti-sigma factor [Acidobacteriota bacterium]